MKQLRILALVFLCATTIVAQSKDYSKHVNPFVGTGGHGHTFPGATMPFGMVQLSPDTRIDNWDGSSGYHYSDDTIHGFSHTHLSGTGIPDYCDILFMPMLGAPQFEAKAGDKSANGYASKFSHANEKAEPGYYSVKLEDDNIFAEMTATTRVGLHRYTFPESDEVNFILDLKWRDRVLDSEMKIVGGNRIEGYRRSSSWAKNQTIYFVAEFSKPFERVLVSDGKRSDEATYAKGTNVKAALKFAAYAGEQILLKVALSHVSVEGARENLAHEMPGWNFDRTRAEAKTAWNKELAKIEISGGTAAQTANFYTALYHTMVQPNTAQDVTGQYRGHDGKTHSNNVWLGTIHADKRIIYAMQERRRPKHYTVFSLWDTFRAAHPLYTVIDEKRTVDFINTFIHQYEQGGRLPVWELAGEETDTMIGHHAVSVIADAMAKGIKGFDYEKAYAAAKHSAELDHFGLKFYKQRGFISMEDEQESVSKTLEYAYDDWCIAQMAFLLAVRAIDDENLSADYRKYLARSRSFENLFDRETGFMRPKYNGGFVSPFRANEVTFNFTEGNAWQYSFFVPHNVPRLMELYGGREKFAAKLDELFTTTDKLAGREQPDITGLIGQYAHGNEPSHHMAYLYNYAGQPWKAQALLRRIMDEFYHPAPDGLIGNEDCGQMSAWYILSAAGFYSVTPGDPAYQLGAPLFPEMKFNLENGKTFTVKAPNVSAKNLYVKSVKLNGKPYRTTALPHRAIAGGGMLEFEMTGTPVKDAFNSFNYYNSRSDELNDFVAVPQISVAEGKTGRTFKDRITVTLATATADASILYTTDGNDPGSASIQYNGPFTIDKTTVVKAKALRGKGPASLTAEARFFKKPNDWTIRIAHPYNRQYTGGGDEGLIDGIRGTLNFASGEWQGYQPHDLDAVVDLQRETEIKSVGGGFLQDARPWIWMPTRIEFEVSTDGTNFTRVADIKTDIHPADMTPTIRDYKQNIAPVKARYVRIRAQNLGKIPAWHPGAGHDAFIFVDEIFIEQ